MNNFLGIDCGSVSLNLVLLRDNYEPECVYLRTRGRPLQAFTSGLKELMTRCDNDPGAVCAIVTGSGRELLSQALGIPAVNEITAHATGTHRIDPRVRTIVEIGGQDAKFMRIEPISGRITPRMLVFRMNEICAAGTGAFLDEQAQRLGIEIESFGSIGLKSTHPAHIAGRCAVFAKTDMIHHAQEGTPLPDILMGLAYALARNYMASLIKGEHLEPPVSLQGGVMSNEAVVRALRESLGLQPEEIIVPPMHTVLGALGCAVLAARDHGSLSTSLSGLCKRADAYIVNSSVRRLPQLGRSKPFKAEYADCSASDIPELPLILGLDIGSVSVKGVVIDAQGRILKQDYRLSHSESVQAVREVVQVLTEEAPYPTYIAVTGSGRELVGKLLDADLIVNEISAQAAAALFFDPNADAVVEIGGQDSKWISLADGHIQDFEMNRVCAAGTGSFLMAQAERLGLTMGDPFSDAAFKSENPADLGNRCTVFMESDLIHHQNTGASIDDLAAGVCVSIVRNYLERVAGHKTLGKRILFFGGVAATSAVKAAFEQSTGREFQVPPFHRVSGAYGSALKLLEQVKQQALVPNRDRVFKWDDSEISASSFSCNRCSNTCRIGKYLFRNKVVFHGGICERWESAGLDSRRQSADDFFTFRVQMLENLCATDDSNAANDNTWFMLRHPQFYEWFPFWHSFCRELGITLIPAPRIDRVQFEAGAKKLSVETCMPIKVMAGQLKNLTESGARTIFHPAVLVERFQEEELRPVDFCPYIQASSQFFKGSFDVDWKELFIHGRIDPDSFFHEHTKFAKELGFSGRKARTAFESAMDVQRSFSDSLFDGGKRFLESLGPDEKAIVLLGKPYHVSDPFLNMNIGNIFHRLNIRALPGDLFPLGPEFGERSVSWKHHWQTVRVAQAIATDPRLFPVLLTFFGCGPDAFTYRHIHQALKGKPLLMLEMDEHTSKAGIITRVEAFLDRIRNVSRKTAKDQDATAVKRRPPDPGIECLSGRLDEKRTSPIKKVYVPYMSDHSFAFSAAAQSIGIEAEVLPPPDEDSEQLGRPHTMGGECHPFVLILGDYLKMAARCPSHEARKSMFYIIGPDACRVGQYPVYIGKIGRQLGFEIEVIENVGQVLTRLGLSRWAEQRILLRLWEGLNAYDVLLQAFLAIRPFAQDHQALNANYFAARDILFRALCDGHVRQGVEDAFNTLYQSAVRESESKPVIAVTGDYYTRIVSYANNGVYKEIESLGGILWSPPMFSDSLKLGYLRNLVWSLLSGRSKSAAGNGLLFALLSLLEFRIKSPDIVKRSLSVPSDLAGLDLWRKVSPHASTKLPTGIIAPLGTALQQVDSGAHGILNLMALNCAYGTVITTALLRTLRNHVNTPMLTLVYDGLKKTNEKTRLEAFMDQVWQHFRAKTG
ncbi:acyl-CoA dehydratase activase [Desulfomonile tiedjei]|uniref:acyl-CoA dehydratase activase n=1 Tax=Desulfomonile tiedjei TaxID=2358 RepID=UPI0002FF826F|nr:acyl-CoA dehydratase activase [Desulfomonile tiedjei]